MVLVCNENERELQLRSHPAGAILLMSRHQCISSHAGARAAYALRYGLSTRDTRAPATENRDSVAIWSRRYPFAFQA